MTAVLEIEPMTQSRPDRTEASTKIPADLLQKAKHVAIYKGGKLGEYLESILRGPVEKDYARMVKEMGKTAEDN